MFTIQGPYGDSARGWCSPACIHVDNEDELRVVLEAEWDYWTKFADVSEGWEWTLHPREDYIPELDVCDGYPLALYRFDADGDLVAEDT